MKIKEAFNYLLKGKVLELSFESSKQKQTFHTNILRAKRNYEAAFADFETTQGRMIKFRKLADSRLTYEVTMDLKKQVETGFNYSCTIKEGDD